MYSLSTACKLHTCPRPNRATGAFDRVHTLAAGTEREHLVHKRVLPRNVVLIHLTDGSLAVLELSNKVEFRINFIFCARDFEAYLHDCLLLGVLVSSDDFGFFPHPHDQRPFRSSALGHQHFAVGRKGQARVLLQGRRSPKAFKLVSTLPLDKHGASVWRNQQATNRRFILSSSC